MSEMGEDYGSVPAESENTTTGDAGHDHGEASIESDGGATEATAVEPGETGPPAADHAPAESLQSDTPASHAPAESLQSDTPGGARAGTAEPGESGPPPESATLAGAPEHASQSETPEHGSLQSAGAPAAEPGEKGPAEAPAARDQDEPRDEGGRPDISQMYPSDYVEPTATPPAVDGPHESPGSWANDINPAKSEEAGMANCGECARAVQNTWSDHPATAATMAPGVDGEDPGRMEQWAGQPPEPASIGQVSERLTELGPGSSAIVGCEWAGRDDGHYFNAVNDNGQIKAVDGQSGRVESWPPSVEGLGYDESSMSSVGAYYFDSSGKLVR